MVCTLLCFVFSYSKLRRICAIIGRQAINTLCFCTLGLHFTVLSFLLQKVGDELLETVSSWH